MSLLKKSLVAVLPTVLVGACSEYKIASFPEGKMEMRTASTGTSDAFPAPTLLFHSDATRFESTLMSPSGGLVAHDFGNGKIEVWDMATGKIKATLNSSTIAPIKLSRFKDDQTLFVESIRLEDGANVTETWNLESGMLRYWRDSNVLEMRPPTAAEIGETVARLKNLPEDEGPFVASPKNGYLLSGDWEVDGLGGYRIYQSDHQIMRELPGVISAEFSTIEDNILYTLSKDGSVERYDLLTGISVKKFDVNATGFSPTPGHTRLVVSDQDATIGVQTSSDGPGDYIAAYWRNTSP